MMNQNSKMTRREACYFLGIGENASEEQIKEHTGIRQNYIIQTPIQIQIQKNIILKCRTHMSI